MIFTQCNKMKFAIRFLSVLFFCIIIASCTSETKPKVTMNPEKDAQTCIELYKKDFAKGQEYMDNAITTYYMQGKRSEYDKFAIIVTEAIAKM